MLFDTTLCVLILVSALWIGIGLFGTVSGIWGRYFSRNKKEPTLQGSLRATDIILLLWMMLPYKIASSGLLQHEHPWWWYVGCLCLSVVVSCITFFLVLKVGREQVVKKPYILLPLAVAAIAFGLILT